MHFRTEGNATKKRWLHATKTLLIMKLIVFFLFVLCFQVGATGNAQQVTLTLKNVPLTQVFNEIEKQTGYHFFYKDKLLTGAPKTSVNVRNISVSDALNESIEQLPLTFSIVGKMIVIREKAINHRTEIVNPRAGDELFAEIKGVVRDQDGNPLQGVSVLVKGTTRGTSTRSDGSFSIEAPNDGTLIFSFVGYEQVEVKIDSRSTINVVLQNGTKSLSEVVVTSFGIQRDKKLLGYGVSEVNGDNLEKAPTADVTNQLAGKIAGVLVSGGGGGFAGSNVTIRGYSTFTGSNQPLYVVDGVPIDNSGGSNGVNTGVITSSRISDLNTEDIENIQVLKGAAATVLYGSRGASGVILITTKKGKQGHRVDFTTSNAVGIVSRFPTFQNLYAQGSGGVYNNSIAGSWGPLIEGQEVTNWFGEKESLHAYPNNVRDILQTAFSTNDNISFSGAGTNFNYRASYGISSETGLVPENTRTRNNFTVNAGLNVSKKFTISTSFSYINNLSDRTQSGNQGSNPLWRGIYTPRSYDLTHAPIVDDAGNQLWFAPEDQPYWAIKHVKRHSELNRFFGNVNFSYKILEWLRADLKVGADVFTFNSKGFDDKGIRGNGNVASAGAGGVVDGANLRRNINSYFTISADRNLSDNFKLNVTLGNEILSDYTNSQTTTGFSIVVPGFQNISNFISYTPTGSITQNRNIGVFGDLVLDYKRYLSINLKGRNDFTSTLAPGNRSIFYPALAISFVPTSAFESLSSDVFNSGKIRFNIGEVGKGTSPYSIGTFYTVPVLGDGYGSTNMNFPFSGLAGFNLSGSAGNLNLTPEFTREMELGLELDFFNRRLRFDGSIYKRDSRHLIFTVPVPTSSGSTSVLSNAGKLSTKGLEFLLSGTPVRSSKLKWETTLNFSMFKSMVKELAPGVSELVIGGFTSPRVKLEAGKEYGEIYSTIYKRNEKGELLINAAGFPIESIEDAVGNFNPDYTLGFNNSFEYGQFSLSFLLFFSQGGDLLSRTVGDLRINGVSSETAEFPRFNQDGSPNKPYVFQGVSDVDGRPNTVPLTAQDYFGRRGIYAAWEGYVRDVTFLKMREINFTYRFPRGLFSGFVKNLSVSAYASNIFLWAPHYPDLDPEQSLTGIGNSRGLEFGIQPTPTNIGITLKATF